MSDNHDDHVEGGKEDGTDSERGSAEEAEPEVPPRVAELLAEPSTWDEPPPGVLETVLSRIRAERGSGDGASEVTLVGTELAANAAGEASVRGTADGVAVTLRVRDLPPADEGTHYEVWLSRSDGSAVAAGTFDLRDGDEPVELSATTGMLENDGWTAVTVVIQRDRGRRRPRAPIVLHGSAPRAAEPD